MNLFDHNSRNDGIALIMVMIVITVLGILAGGFAYSMKVELQLAKNQNNSVEMEWLGRSGLEFAKYILGQQLAESGEPYDALNQKWAGGTGVTNEVMMGISLENNKLGNGEFSLEIIDLERKFNINLANNAVLNRALELIGFDVIDSSAVVDSIMDWRDSDDDPHLTGVESDFYLNLENPYHCKNGPLDHISELLMINGVTPEMYYGPSAFEGDSGLLISRRSKYTPFSSQLQDEVSDVGLYDMGLKDLFTTTSGRLINVNTAPPAVLQLIPMVDKMIAQSIVQIRAGPDGREGNEDDTPFRNIGELINVPGIMPETVDRLNRYLTVRSTTFEVHINARISGYKREYVAVMRRNGPSDFSVLYFTWE
ncbi:MAG: general secretion pathway protein GspK [Verrucomicrobia bacterium]|nr:general secretion pathway protein GspK [Verrucomicrobiota bacterium]MCF7707314.1 general secretion pathway protein GspK [Verrucomicrobiota bacterium]